MTYQNSHHIHNYRKLNLVETPLTPIQWAMALAIEGVNPGKAEKSEQDELIYSILIRY